MKKHIMALSSVAILALGFAGCTKKIDEAYANPNAPVKVPVEQLLAPIISSMACNSAGHGTMNDIRFIGKYIQNFLFCNSAGVWDQQGIVIGSDNAASIWRAHFYDIGQNCVKMMQWAEEEKKWDYVGVGQAIMAWSWLTLTDYHGEVIRPEEAFNTSALTFSYATQEEIYTYVRNLCQQSLANLNKTGDGVSQANLALGDAYFYNGDVNKWKKFVYGVLARSFHHLTNKSIYKPDSVVYYCNLAMTTNADNATVKFAATSVSGTNNFFGPLRGNLASTVSGTETAIRQASYIVNLMTGANGSFSSVVDPRAIYLLRLNSNGTFKGLTPNAGQSGITALDRPESFWGISQAAGVDNTAPGNDNNCRYVFRNSAPFPIMTASEILFMKAEALYRMNDKPGALAAYRDAIAANFDMLMDTYSVNVPSASVITPAIKNNFLANTTVVPTDPNNLTLSKIMLQKYIALYVHGACETWVDMRRYHYTDLDPVTGGQVYSNFTIPTLNTLNAGKLVYRIRPRFNSEYVWNLNELTRIGATVSDYHTKECWFSKP